MPALNVAIFVAEAMLTAVPEEPVASANGCPATLVIELMLVSVALSDSVPALSEKLLCSVVVATSPPLSARSSAEVVACSVVAPETVRAVGTEKLMELTFC